MDVIHYHIRHVERNIKRAIYIASGIDMDGHKCSRMYVGKMKVRGFGYLFL